VNDEIDALKAKASAKTEEQDEKTVTWRPEQGDELIGELIRGKIVNTARGQSTLIVVKERDTEEMYTVWCSTGSSTTPRLRARRCTSSSMGSGRLATTRRSSTTCTKRPPARVMGSTGEDFVLRTVLVRTTPATPVPGVLRLA
jgi:hypothetical protein